MVFTNIQTFLPPWLLANTLLIFIIVSYLKMPVNSILNERLTYEHESVNKSMRELILTYGGCVSPQFRLQSPQSGLPG